MEEIVFLDGEFIRQDAAKISVFSNGLLYGWGVFETMRAYCGKIVYLGSHLKRIQVAARLLYIGLPYSLDKLKVIIKKTIEINAYKDSYVKLAFFKSEPTTTTLVISKKYAAYPVKKYQRGFSACVSNLRQQEGSLLAGIKSTNYLLYQLSYEAAKDRGFDEAIILNNRGCLCEGSRSNIFFVKGKEIFTPCLESGCLGGITRKAIFDLAKKYRIKIYQGNFNLSDLSGSSEAFLTNSLLGVMPLSRVDGKKIGQGLNKLTHFLRRKYNRLLSRRKN